MTQELFVGPSASAAAGDVIASTRAAKCVSASARAARFGVMVVVALAIGAAGAPRVVAAEGCPENTVAVRFATAEGRRLSGVSCRDAAGAAAPEGPDGARCVVAGEPQRCVADRFREVVFDVAADADGTVVPLDRAPCLAKAPAEGETVVVWDTNHDVLLVPKSGGEFCPADGEPSDFVVARKPAAGPVRCETPSPRVGGGAARGADAAAFAVWTIKPAAASVVVFAREAGAAADACPASLARAAGGEEVRPDARGVFTLRVPAGRAIALEVEAAGAAPLALRVPPLAPGERRPLGELAPRRAGRIEGEIQFDDEAPARRRRANVARFSGASLAEAFADTDGRFAVDVAESVPLRVSARGAGFALLPRVAPGTTASATLRAAPETPLFVKAVDPDGKPLDGVSVELRDIGNWTGPRAAAAKTGRFGWGVLAAQPGRRFGIFASRQGFADATEGPLAVPDARPRTIVLRLDRGRTLRGVVLSPDGLPASSAKVTLRGPQTTRTADTRGDGGFAFERVPDMRAYLVVESEAGYAFRTIDTNAQDLVRIKLERNGSLVGSVEGAAEPASLSVVLDSETKTAAVGPDGGFAFRAVGPGLHRVELRGLRDAAVAQNVVIDSGKETKVAFVVGEVIRGRVVRRGAPVAEARVTWCRWAMDDGPGGNMPRSVNVAETDDDGVYVVRGVGPGRYTVMVEHEGTRHLREERVAARQGEVAPIEIGGAPVSGSVIDAETGAPIVGATIVVHGRGSWPAHFSEWPLPDGNLVVAAQGRGASESGAADESGRFALEVQPGEWTVAVQADGYEDAAETLVVRDADADDLALRMAPLQVIEGEMARADGSPATGSVGAQCDDAGMQVQITTALGHFRLESARGRCTVAGVSGNELGLVAGVSPQRAADLPTPLKLIVEAPGALTIVAKGSAATRSASGLPAPSILDAGGTNIMLLLRNLSANLGPFAAARRDGDALRFRCQSLPAGNYTIVWGAERRPATITSGGDTTVEFDGP